METAVEVSESETIELAAGGHTPAFEELVHLYQSRVRGFLALRLADASRVDDLAQEVFLIAYRRLGTFDASQPFYPWLKGIALNVLRNEGRKRRATPQGDLEEHLERLAVEQMRDAEDEDVLFALAKCLETLDEAARALLNAYYRKGLTLNSIAENEGKSAKALSVALVRIRRRLRECIHKRLRPEGAGP
jgi:RNA polymerase sigma-70 factor (ECF subfamily)